MKTDGCFITAELTSMSEWPPRRCVNLAEVFNLLRHALRNKAEDLRWRLFRFLLKQNREFLADIDVGRAIEFHIDQLLSPIG
jgi:hypothetical protein